MTSCLSIGGIIGDFIATSFPACALGCSSVGDCKNTGGDLVTSHFWVTDEVIGVIPIVLDDAVVFLTAGIVVERVEGTGKKLKQSS